MKKQLTYAQIERKHVKQSHWLARAGAVVLLIAIFGVILSVAGARREYAARQALLASVTEKYAGALSNDDKLALASADIGAYMLSLLDEAREQKLATLNNQRKAIAEQDGLEPLEDAQAPGGALKYAREGGRMRALSRDMEVVSAQALALADDIRASYGADMTARFSESTLKLLLEKQALDAVYDEASDLRKTLKSAQTAAKKPLTQAQKEGSGATEAEIQAAQAAYDEATKVYEKAEHDKNIAYDNQQAAIARMRNEFARASAQLPGMSFWQRLALACSSPIVWGALLALGAELCLIGWACIKKPKRVPMSVLADVIIYDFFVVLGAVMLAPLMYVAVGSFSSTGLAQFRFGRFDISAYRMIAFSARTMRSVGNSFLITIAGTLMNITITSITAYALSKKDLPGRGWMMKLVVVFMLFHAGLIPDYMLIANKLKLSNSYWAIWLPVLISSSNLIIMKNFFQQLPESIEESARIDGCNEIQSFIHIVLPMSMASIATFSLFYAVGHWNNYQRAMIYVTEPNKYPITVLLRQVVILSQGSLADDVLPEVAVWAPTNSVKYATIMIGTIPIICVYPFLQKHFTKGVLLGSVKG